MATVLDLTAKDAKKFFLKSENYFTGDLPQYFSFQEILNVADGLLKDKELKDIQNQNPSQIENVNYDIVINKNNNYSWRKLTAVNPILYVDLVNCICSEENWLFLQNKFREFRKNPNICVSSIPVLPEHKRKQKGSQINNWISKFEKESAKLSMFFAYMACTDISDCYSSIYTHVIPWAFYGVDFAKQHRGKKENFGNVLDSKLSNLSYGQTNGIPQGSVLMDFIAEIVFGYIDVLLTNKIEANNISDYKILRYRDDYRIFTNSIKDTELIIKLINDICRNLGLKLNSEKTCLTSDVITGSIRNEKFYIWPEYRQDKQNLFLVLYEFAKRFENSGVLQTCIGKINKKIRFNKNDDLELLLNIMLDIAFNNPKVIPQAFAIISKILKRMSVSDRFGFIRCIKNKFDKKAYTDFVYIWIQRLSLACGENLDYVPTLCKLISDDNINLWNNSWLKPHVRSELLACKLVNIRLIKHLALPIRQEEIEVFDENLEY